MSSDEFKLLKEQVKNLEATLKNYENHIYMLQGDLQYTQKAFQMEQSKMHAQIAGLVGLVFDVVKENRQYEEAREAQMMQKLNAIMNVGDDYTTLNNALTATATTSMANDANSLINGTIASLTSSQSNTANTTAILPSSSSTRLNNDQLLTPTSLQQSQMLTQPQQQQVQQQQQQLHQLQQQSQLSSSQLNSSQLSSSQLNYQQLQPQLQSQSRMLQLQQQQQSQQQQQNQQNQQQQQHSNNNNNNSNNSNSQHVQQQSNQRSSSQSGQSSNQHRRSHGHQSRHNSGAHMHSSMNTQQTDEAQTTTVTPAPTTKRRKTNRERQQRNAVPQATTDPSSILDDPLNVTVNPTRHVPIAISPASAASMGNSNESPEKEKGRKMYDKEYAFIKAPTSVEEIWNEYAIGLNGQPSIKSLEDEYKTGWRRDPATSKKFNRRKAIYNAIEKGLSKGFTVDMCIRMLEDYRFLDREKNLKQPIGWLMHGNLPPALR